MSEVTQILARVGKGDSQAAVELLPLVYAELRRLATHLMQGESPGHTLQPTALVHEAWLRLGADAQPHWQNRAHFFGASAEAMRRILVDHARRRLRVKRGAGVEPLDVDEVEIASPIADDDLLLRLSDALEKYAAVDTRKAELVKLRYFVGMTHEEAAATLGIAVPTVDKVSVRNPNTSLWEEVWSSPAVPAPEVARIFTVSFPMTSFPVDAIRIELNSPAVPNWNEIDAVSISGVIP